MIDYTDVPFDAGKHERFGFNNISAANVVKLEYESEGQFTVTTRDQHGIYFKTGTYGGPSTSFPRAELRPMKETGFQIHAHDGGDVVQMVDCTVVENKPRPKRWLP